MVVISSSMEDELLKAVEFSENDFNNFQHRLNNILHVDGFECAAFKVQFYNEIVHPTFKLPYDPDTLAFVVINSPKMFEKTFLPYVKRNTLNSLRDPIDQCLQNYFENLKEEFGEINLEVIQDFELWPNRRPKALLQTAAHVSGIAYFYQRSDVDVDFDPWKKTKKVYGVCIHPNYGGWFAIRALLILKNVTYPTLIRKEPIDCVSDVRKRVELLEQFNNQWQDSVFRDIIPVKESYSPLQLKYFDTKPKDRFDLLEEILHTGC